MSSLHLFTSYHGADRLRERLSVHKSDADRHALEAMDRGLPREETGGQLRHFLDVGYHEHGGNSQAYVHRNAVWIFRSNTLVTCYPLPGRLAKDAVLQTRKWAIRRGTL